MQLKNHFQYDALDSSSSETSTEEGESEAGGSTIAASSDDDNNTEGADAVSITSSASLMDFSDVNREKRISAALAPMSFTETSGPGMSLRRQLETDMNSILNRGEEQSQAQLRVKSVDREPVTKRKVCYHDQNGCNW